MTETFDLIVLGAGPAGGEAALAAARCGLQVALIDEGAEPGGQVWRAPRTDTAKSASHGDPDRTAGDGLRDRLAASDVVILSRAQVWDVRYGFAVSCTSEDHARLVTAPRLVVATGAIERVRPFSGWTTPGIFGLAAATALLKSDASLPGCGIVVAGQGPLLVAVAAKACALGKPPRAVVDLAGTSDWLRALPGFAAAPRLLWSGARWLARLTAARVPIFRNSEVIRADGGDCLSGVTIRHRTSGLCTDIAADALFVGNGLAPADEVLRLLGAAQEPDALRGGFRTLCDDDRRSSVPGLYVAGDCAGVHGALPSAAQGRIAGLAAAHDHGALDAVDFAARSRAARHQLRRLMPFANAACRLMQAQAGALDSATDDTVICRCEDVTLGSLRAAIRDGAADLNQLKHFTRMGMGPCQGRFCALNAADLLSQTTGATTGDIRLTPRTPLRPIEMGQLIGTFDYADIPVPKPAPL